MSIYQTKNIVHFESFFVRKYLQYGLHLGGQINSWNPSIKPFLLGFRNNFCIFNPQLSSNFFKKAIRFLNRLLYRKKRILFIGTPFGLEKEFVSLCSNYGHYVFNREQKSAFVDFQKTLNSKPSPSLIFIFSLPGNSFSLNDFVSLNLPVMSFVDSSDDFPYVDFPLPGNIKSLKGGLFMYNFFFFLFKNYRKYSLIIK